MAAMPALISSKIWSLYIALTVVVVRDRYSLLLALKKKQKQKKKSCATNNTGRKEQYIPHSPLNHRHRQSTEVF